MRKNIYTLVIIALVFLALSITNAGDYVSGRETITISSVTFDGNYYVSTIYMPAGGAGNNISGSIKLWGVNISKVDYMNFTVWNNETTPIKVNLTVNGIKLMDNLTVSSGSEITKTKTDYITAGGNTSLIYINWTFNCNQSDDEYLNITIVIDNKEATYIDDVITITEWVKTTPHIEMNRDDTWYSVEDKIHITNDATIDLANINITFSYPYQALNPSSNNIFISSLNSGQSTNKYISYQKQGPYIKSIGSPSRNAFGEYELYMRIKSYEYEENVTWSIDYTSSEWRDYFPQLDVSSLEIYINDEPIDFATGNNIYMEYIQLDDGINDVYMKWTPSAPSTPIPPYEEELFTFDIGFIIGILIIIFAILIIFFILFKT